MEYQTNDYELIYMIREHNLEEELLYQKYEPMIEERNKKVYQAGKVCRIRYNGLVSRRYGWIIRCFEIL